MATSHLLDILLRHRTLTHLSTHTHLQRLSFVSSVNHNVFVKRDDFLGTAFCNGSKLRKWASIIPQLMLLNHNTQLSKIVLAGSLASNHVLTGIQLLRMHNIPFSLHRISRLPAKPYKGNSLFTSLLLSADQLAQLECLDTAQIDDLDSYIIPEGASHPHGLPGLLTLPLSLLSNEQEENIHFDDIWIDAGTGATASVLVAALASIQQRRPTTIHIVQCAPPASSTSTTDTITVSGMPDFNNDLAHILSPKLASALIQPPPQFTYQLLRPIEAKSFGSVTGNTINTVRRWAQHSGILFDLMYGTKMLLAFEKWMVEQNQLLITKNIRNTLIIHSGGVQSLSGFEHMLQRTIS